MAENATSNSGGHGFVATSCPVDNDRTISEKRAKNSKININRLPHELLSGIFLIAEVEARRTRSKTEPYNSVQEIASHVCSYWRNVAINNPMLWTYIHVTRPQPQELAYLYLSRAGPTSLLDIDLDLRSNYWHDLNPDGDELNRDERILKQTVHILDMLQLLAVHGDHIDRWRSLSVCAVDAEILLILVIVLSVRTAPALQALSLTWEPSTFFGEEIERSIIPNFRQSMPKLHSSTGISAPNLRHVALPGVSWSALLGPHMQPFTGLTSLRLTAICMPHNPPDLYNLLSSNPQLEVLYISHGYTLSAEIDLAPRAYLPSLRSLSIIGCSITYWVLSVLLVIDAPALQSLTIQAFEKQRRNVGVAKYIATGDEPNNSSRQPIFPMLRELDICRFSCPNSELATLLLALPSVTRLSLRGNQADILCTPPWPLPNLDILTFPFDYHLELGELLRRRAEAGYRVGTLGLKDVRSIEDVGELPDSVRVKVNAEFVVHYCDCPPFDLEVSSDEESSGDGESDDSEDDDYGAEGGEDSVEGYGEDSEASDSE